MHDPISEKKVLDAGLVALMRVDGSDVSPAEAARTSYRTDAADYTDRQNDTLVEYLIRHHHTSPLRFAGAVFYMKMPIFVARQLVRHTAGVGVNESSLRYVEPCREFWTPSPEECRRQSTDNKQGSSTKTVDDPEAVRAVIEAIGSGCLQGYDTLIEHGLSKELARTVLPLGQYTTWMWTGNLQAIFHLLSLRIPDPAGNNVPQWQTEQYARAMLELIEPHFPNCVAAFRNHTLESVTFSGDEMRALGAMLSGLEHGIPELVDRHSDLRASRKRELVAKLRAYLPKDRV